MLSPYFLRLSSCCMRCQHLSHYHSRGCIFHPILIKLQCLDNIQNQFKSWSHASKTRSCVKMFGKPCYNYRGHMNDSISMKLVQKLYLYNIRPCLWHLRSKTKSQWMSSLWQNLVIALETSLITQPLWNFGQNVYLDILEIYLKSWWNFCFII